VKVVDPEKVPKNVTKERPQGKKAKFYCVRFLPTGELCVSSLFIRVS
jgi:hypothetical protein